jgi:hypothetical protein
MPIANKTVGVEVKTTMTGAPQVASGLTQIKSGLTDIAAAAPALVGGLAAVAGGVGAIVTAGKAVVGMAMDLEQAALAYDKLSQKTGASVQFLSGFTQAADDMRVSSDAVNTSLVKYADNFFKTKGASANVERELMSLADAFQKMPDGPAKTAMAIDAFGRSGAEMIPILNRGSAAIREMMQAADQAGLVIGQKTVEDAKRLHEQLDQLNDSWEGLKNKIGGEVIPVLVDGLTQANTAVSVLFTQMTIADGWAKMVSGAQMSQAELVKLKDAIDTYNESMRGSSSMTDSMVNALAGVPGAASVMGAAMVQASEDALRAAANTEVAIAMLASAQGAAAAASAAAIKGTQQVLSNAYASQYAIYQKGVSTQQRANRALTDSMKVVVGTSKEVGMTMMSEFSPAMDKATRSAGGAAKAVKEVANAQDALKQKTSEMQGLMGTSLEPMNKMQKLQSAYALATGQTTLAQEQMKIAVQGVMKGFDAGSISMGDALGLVLALRNGQIDYTRALQAAGPSAQPYINDLNEFTSAAAEGAVKTLQLSQGVDNLPGKAQVQIAASVTGMPQVDDLHDRVKNLPTEKTVTIKAVVIGLDQLAGDFYNYAPRTGSQPILPTPGNLDTGGAPPAQGSSPQTVNVNVDGAAVARASVNNGAGATTQNRRRNYRQP